MPIALIAWVAAAILLAAAGLIRPVRVAIAALLGYVAGWILQILVAVAPSVALTLAEGLIHAFETDRVQWAKVVNVFAREFVGGAVPAADIEQAVTDGGLAAAAPVLAKPLIDAVLAAIVPAGDLTPESGQENLNALVGLNVLLRLQGWWVGLVGDIASLGRFGAAADLPEAMEQALGLTRLMRIAWRTPVKKAIEEPLTRLYNRQYRFTTYSLAEATAAHHRKLLTDDEFLEAAHDLGYSYEKASVLLTLAQKAIPEADVEALWRRELLEEQDALNLITEQGYGPDRAATIWEARRGVKGQALLDETASTTRRLFKAGDLGEDEYRQLLAEAHYRDEEIDLALRADQLALREEKSLTPAQQVTLFERAVIDEVELRRRLRAMHYTDPTIDELLALQTRTLTTAQVLDLFSRGRIPRDEATTRLERLGYSAADSSSLLDLRTRTLSEGQVLDALGKQLINVETARVDLQQLGYTDEIIDILLAFQRKTLSPAEIQAAVSRQLISPAEALGRLIQAGYSQADAQTIVDLRFRLLTVGQTLDAYGEDLVTRVDAQRDLEAKGFSTDDALRLLAMFDAKQAAAAAKKAAAPPRRPAPPSPPPPPPGP